MKPDVNKPVENPKLRVLFDALRKADNSEVNALHEAIAEEIALNACLLAVININENDIEKKNDGTSVFKKESHISFEMLRLEDETTYLPVYTDWDELRKSEKYKDAYIKTLMLSFDDMVAITAEKSGIVINPFNDNFIIKPENVAHMKQHKDIVTKGFSEQVNAKDTNVLIGEPANYPTEMVEAIKRNAKKTKAIKTIWLKLMIKNGEKSYLLIVDYNGDRNAVFKSIADTAVPYLENGFFIDLVSLSDSFGKKAATGEPFYRRKKWIFG